MRRLTFLIPLIFSSALLFSQIDIREDFYDAEFFFAEEDYEEALYAFTKVYKAGNQDNANINYRIGVCLLNIPGKKTEAIPYLEKAVQNITDKYKEGSVKEVQAPKDAILYLGNAYRINYELDKAIEQYNLYKTLLDPKAVDQLLYSNMQIESCKNAEKAIKNPICYSVGNLGQLMESAANKFNPVVSGDLNTLAFMGKHKFYNGVYVAKKIDGKWTKTLNITPSIQSDGNQYVVSMSNDGLKILLSWFDEFDSDIFYTEWANNRWTRSQPIGKPVNSKFFESHACFSPDEQTIYFTSNRKESLGGMDIFRCDRLEDDSWGDAVNLGEGINTSLNEETPMISPDGKRLYFSSQGHSTIGGYDIFYSDLQADGSWGEPVNIGFPLNTTDDDLTFSPLHEQVNTGFNVFAKGDHNQKDLFVFDMIPTGSQPIILAFEEPDRCLKTEEEVAEVVVEEVVEIVVEEEVVEVIEVEKFIVKPVFFGFDSYALSATAIQKLNDFATILNKFPNLKVEINGHTDAIGSFEYNKSLSSKRAKSVADYLANQGISRERFKVSALSESEHIAINRTSVGKDSPEGRQLNRRVQFKVSMTDKEALIVVEKIPVPDNLKIK